MGGWDGEEWEVRADSRRRDAEWGTGLLVSEME
jgi:hypothetical protein